MSVPPTDPLFQSSASHAQSLLKTGNAALGLSRDLGEISFLNWTVDLVRTNLSVNVVCTRPTIARQCGTCIVIMSSCG